MTIKIWTFRNEYRDSMVLMLLSARLTDLPGVERAVALMATDANKELLRTLGLWSASAGDAGPSDLLIAARFPRGGKGAAEALEAAVRDAVAGQAASPQHDGGAPAIHRSVESGIEVLPGANLALVSVPGPHAAGEARRALDLGLNVFLFSDNVPVEDEVRLKQQAEELGLLVMGPDCGTAIINGVALGFANVVRPGPIGIVGAAGTGIQELCALIDRAGGGVSQAIGTGGRDLWEKVGAMTTLRALDWLEADPGTEVVLLVSKIPSPAVAARVLDRAAAGPKPVVACLLGYTAEDYPRDPAAGPVVFGTLSEAAEAALRLVKRRPSGRIGELTGDQKRAALRERADLAPGQKYVRGLFSGGSLCEEALVVWRDTLGPAWSNVPLQPGWRLRDPQRSRHHTAIDLGDDYFTVGRPHPMVDPGVRIERIVAEARDPEAAVLVLDVVLGHGTHPDMAGALLPAIAEARRIADADGRALPVVAHVCGTAGDPQGLAAQEAKLRAAGVNVLHSNAAAARFAALIVK